MMMTHLTVSLISSLLSLGPRSGPAPAGRSCSAPTPALAQLEALDGDHLDPGLAHLRDGVGVPLVGDDHARLEGDDVVAVVPLLALLLVRVAAGLDHLEVAHAEGVGDRRKEALLLGDVELPLGSVPGAG